MAIDEQGRRAVGLQHVVFAGIDLSDHFEVMEVQAPAFGSITANTSDVPGKAGVHFHSKDEGPIEIVLRMMARADDENPASVIERWRGLKPLLVHDEPERLHLDSERYYKALVTGDFGLSFMGPRGAVDVTFTCFDPRLFGETHVHALKAGENRLYVRSGSDVWPTVKVTGASPNLQVRNQATYDQVLIPDSGEAEITIDMENCKVASGLGFLPVDLSVSDFFQLRANEEACIYLSSGEGTVEYTEVY